MDFLDILRSKVSHSLKLNSFSSIAMPGGEGQKLL